MHAKMLRCILRSPMSFFDTTPVGRMMNRFSFDIDVLDDRMPRIFRLWSFMFFGLLSIIIVISVNTPSFMIALVPISVLYVVILVSSENFQFLFLHTLIDTKLVINWITIHILWRIMNDSIGGSIPDFLDINYLFLVPNCFTIYHLMISFSSLDILTL